MFCYHLNSVPFRVRLSGFVDFAMMSESESGSESESEPKHEHLHVVILANDAVVTGAGPPFTGAADALNRFRWSWILGQKVTAGMRRWTGTKCAQLPLYGRCIPYGVRHARPRSACIWSPGVGSFSVWRISSRDSSAARMSAVSSASSMSRSRSSASMMVATRRPRRDRKTGSCSEQTWSMIDASCSRGTETVTGIMVDMPHPYVPCRDVQGGVASTTGVPYFAPIDRRATLIITRATETSCGSR